jgi:hypothetical protein
MVAVHLIVQRTLMDVDTDAGTVEVAETCNVMFSADTPTVTAQVEAAIMRAGYRVVGKTSQHIGPVAIRGDECRMCGKGYQSLDADGFCSSCSAIWHS